MRCPGCGTENEPEGRFCDACGASLDRPCPSCGSANRTGARFCKSCGTALGDTSPATPSSDARGPAVDPGPEAEPVAAVAERRLVSVMFVDLVGFTTLSEGRDPEETRDLLSRYFEIARDVVGRYGGTIEKFIGDAVMAVWGTPTAHEDDAERAVRAALDLVDAVSQLEPDLRARAGILTGSTAVTLGARGQGMVAGDLVNTASRLQSVAPPGTVLVDDATERTASKAIVFEPAGDQVLKGRTAPVPAFLALRVVAERGGVNRSATLEAPFVGREGQLRLLKELYHATGVERRARLISVTGLAGVGKSRLAWEFEKYLDGLVEPVRWHHGRSPAYGEGITFWALGEMVRGRATLLETDDEATTRQKIAETVARWVPDESERRWIEPALLALLAVEPAPAGSRESLFAAWRTFFERVGADGTTVVLVFEDVHWSDPGLLDFIDHILDWSSGVSILILTLARSDLIERRPDWGAGRRNFLALHLDPLPETSMHGLLTGLVPGLPSPAARAIVRRADGIPLYAIETVRMLVAEGRLVERGGSYEPVGDLTGLATPETLHALIAARLDGLEPAARSLLQDAAVLGQSFSIQGLAGIAGLETAVLEARLRPLVQREILRQEIDPRSPERGQYAFVQALIREVAYGTLARRDRRDRHLAAARYFEKIGEGEMIGALATHYLAAYGASAPGAEADALARQARISLRAAADRAAGLGSYEQAMSFLAQGLEVTTDIGERASLLELASHAASSAGRHARAEELAREALALRRAIGDAGRIVTTATTLARVLLFAVRSEAALAVLEPVAEEFAALADTREGIALHAQLARAYFFLERLGDAIRTADVVLAGAERADLQALTADTMVTKGTALAAEGRPLEGAGAIRAAVTLAEQQGLTQIALRGRLNLSHITLPRDPRQALEIALEALADAERLGHRPMLIVMANNAAEAAVRVGDWDSAAAQLAPFLTAQLDPEDRLVAVGGDARIRALRGEDVQAAIDEMVEIGGGAEDPQVQAMIAATRMMSAFAAGTAGLSDLAEEVARANITHATIYFALAGHAALWRRDGAGAERLLARHEATRMHGPAIAAERATLRAGIAALDGRTADAVVAYRDVLGAWRDLGLQFDEALAVIGMGQLLDREATGVAEGLAVARATLTRLRAAPFLRRLEVGGALDDTPGAVHREVDAQVSPA